MIKEIAHDLYNIRVPLPRNPLKELNSYLIQGERNLLIDLGFNRPECEDVISRDLSELGVNRDKTDIFITHLHSDHCGLLEVMDRPGIKKFCSKPDGEIINISVEEKYWGTLAVKLHKYGFPLHEKGYENAVDKHPGKKYRCKKVIDFSYINDNDLLEYGEYKLRCIWVPGHTPGMMCLYEEDKKIFFSADHVLGDITPNIPVELRIENPLSHYLKSLEKVEKLDVDLLLTGHRDAPASFTGRIDELKRHHETRLDEVFNIVKAGASTAFDVASKMDWDIKFDDWDDFPIPQKWFATGEAASHLDYLAAEGRIDKTEADGQYKFI